MKKIRVALAGGGTGGHLFPGLALAEELRRRCPEAQLLLLCTERDEVYRATAELGIESAVIPGSHRGSLLRRAPSLARAFVHSWRRLGRFRPHVVVGLGGYGSLAPVACAWLHSVPCILLEQNVVPGRANRLLSRLADEVEAQWEESVPRFPRPGRVRVTGNPVRGAIQRRDRAAVAAELGLDPTLPTLLVMGGSQGARPLNDLMASAAPIIATSGVRMQVIHLAGSADAERLRASYEQYALPAKVFGFLEDMALAYSACDLALSRAGGTSIAELTAVGIPAILVPYPHAADDHQRLNASALERRGAALVVEQATLSPHRLAHHLAELLGDRERLAAMGRQSRLAAAPSAASVIAERILELASSGNGKRPSPPQSAHERAA